MVVYNPVTIEREDVVVAELEYTSVPNQIIVFDKSGNQLLTQVLERKENKVKFIFLAKLPSAGFSVFDVRDIPSKTSAKTSLAVTGSTLENDYYKVTIGNNGDIVSIIDKKVSKELLKQPARLEFLKEKPAQWPAWNMDWKDRQNAPVDFLDQDASISVIENGPVRIALLVKRKGQNSEIEQVISLSAGEDGKRIEVTNKIDWQSKEVSLKASFPLTVSNKNATYNLGVGAIPRSNNNEVKFEVPSKEWFDLTDQSGDYGVSILEDCKFGSDKPDDNTLRLTLLYTPGISKSFSWCWYQGTQDWGIHDIKYGIYSHKGDWAAAQSGWQAKFLNQPLIAFETSKHPGSLGKEITLIKSSSPQVGIMAFKKMEGGDYYILRVNELFGKDATGIKIKFPGKVSDAYEVNGQEKKIGSADFADGSLNFDITHFTIRSFAVKFEPAVNSSNLPDQVALDIPYNSDMVTNDLNRFDCNNGNGGWSYPAELVPSEIVSEDILFKINNTADRLNNTLIPDGQVINIPAGDYAKLYILAAGTENTSYDLLIDNNMTTLNIQEWTGFIGQFYTQTNNPLDQSLYKIDNPFVKKDNIAWYASHIHDSYPSANVAYQYCYMFRYEIPIPKGAQTLTLPKNRKVRIFAMAVSKNNPEEIQLSVPLSDDFRTNKSLEIRNR